MSIVNCRGAVHNPPIIEGKHFLNYVNDCSTKTVVSPESKGTFYMNLNESYDKQLKDFKKALIRLAFEEFQNKTEVRMRLGISRQTVVNILKS